MDIYQLYAHEQTGIKGDANEVDGQPSNSPDEDQQGRALALDFSQRQPPGLSGEQHRIFDGDEQADVQDYSVRSMQRQQSLIHEQVDHYNNHTAAADSGANDEQQNLYNNYNDQQHSPNAAVHYMYEEQPPDEHNNNEMLAGAENETYANLHAGGNSPSNHYADNEDAADTETDAQPMFGTSAATAGSNNSHIFILRKPTPDAAVSSASMAHQQPSATMIGANLSNDDDDTTADDDSNADDDDDVRASANSSSQNETTTAEKPFKCPTCGRGFRLQTQLNSHNEIVHLKRRPFACKVCNIDFSCRGNFTKHCETKNHQKKAQELAEAGAPVTPEMILTGEALKAHLAKMKAEARSSAKILRTQATSRSPAQSSSSTSTTTVTVKKSPTSSSTKLTITTAAAVAPTKNGSSAVRASRNTTPSLAAAAPHTVSLVRQRAPSATTATTMSSIVRHMGNGGTVTSIHHNNPPDRINSTSSAAGSYNHSNNNNSPRKRIIDDVDEYERLVAELDACKTTLTEVQKHCKKLQTEKEKLEMDHPVMRERIDGLAEQVRYKSCLLKKLDARKTALSTTANGNASVTSAGVASLFKSNATSSTAVNHNHNGPISSQLFSSQSDGIGTTSDGSPSAFSSPSEQHAVVVVAKRGEGSLLDAREPPVAAVNLTLENAQQNLVDDNSNIPAMPLGNGIVVADDADHDNAEADEDYDEMVLAPSQMPLG